MKRGRLLLLVLFSGFLFLHPAFLSFVRAAGDYPMACSKFEVSYINDDGSFSKVACYDDFKSANNRMRELGGDHVVRSATAYSPTKIVAMNSGLAYAYPGRGGKATLNIYEDLYDHSIRKKTTYVSHHYELYYHETSLVTQSGREGMVKVTLNGFEGYTDLEFVDLVPSKYLDRGIALWIGGQNSYFNESAFNIVVQRNSYRAVRHGSYLDLQYTFHLAYPIRGSLMNEEYSINIGPAPSFMKEGVSYYSADSVHFYADSALTEAVGTEYSYYQWLPLRSQTNISAAELEAYLRSARSNYSESKLYQHANVFVEGQSTYGINGLLVYAMAAHESAFGLSNFAKERNNLFGWKAYDASPGSAQHFPSVEQSVKEHMGINLRGYVDITDGRFFNSSLGNKGAGLNVKYASDPYWGMKIAAIAYEADKSSNNYNGQLKDYGKYDLAIIKTLAAEVKAAPNVAANTLYTTEYGPTYQKDFLVIHLGEVGEYTKIQSTNGLKEDGSIITHLTPPTVGEVNPISTYDFSRSVVYIKNSDLQALNYQQSESGPTAGEYVHSFERLSWVKGQFALRGEAYIRNLMVDSANVVTHKLVLVGEEEHSFTFESTKQVVESSFDEVLDFSELPLGTYTLRFETSYSGNSEWKNSFLLDGSLIPTTQRIGNRLYTFSVAGGRLQLSVSEEQEENMKTLVSAKNIVFNSQSGLSFNGIGVFMGIDTSNLSASEYELILYPLNEGGKAAEFAAETVDSNGFSLNDGVNYQYGAYKTALNLRDISEGRYRLVLRLKNGDLEKEVPISNSRVENRHVSFEHEGAIYRLSANELLNYRLELEKLSTPLDFTAIHKPSARASLVSFDKFTFDDNELSLNAHAMIYYADYPDLESATYELWAVDNKENYVKFDTVTTACEINYTKLLRTSNNADCICFRASKDLSSLNSGKYFLYVTIRNGEYYDIVSLGNRSFRVTPSSENVEVVTDRDSWQIYLNVK